MKRVRLIHWNKDEARERLSELRAAGYTVEPAAHSLKGEPLHAARSRTREQPPA